MIAPLNAKRDQIAYRLNDLNRQMTRQPIKERRANWSQYYRRLAELMKLQNEVTEATAALLELGNSGQRRPPPVSTLVNTLLKRRA